LATVNDYRRMNASVPVLMQSTPSDVVDGVSASVD